MTRTPRPVVAASMFGVTTPCVEAARKVLEAAGYEVLVFHATGTGGRTMEGLIRDGLIAGVLDITTTELADELALYNKELQIDGLKLAERQAILNKIKAAQEQHDQALLGDTICTTCSDSSAEKGSAAERLSLLFIGQWFREPTEIP